MRQLVLLGMTACVVAACSYVPLGALMTLRGVDLLRADADQLRVAIIAPGSISFTEEPQLVLSRVVPGRDRADTRLAFQETAGPDSPEGDADRTTRTYRLAPAQSPRLRAFQDGIRALQQAGVRGRVDLTVDLKLCDRAPAPTTGVTDIYIRVRTGDPFTRVLREVPSAALVTAQTPVQGLPPCS